MIHQLEWVAAAKPLAEGAGGGHRRRRRPTTATPSVTPTWRLVEATAAATPAWAAGMPDTAVLVIGGLTSPEPAPEDHVGGEQEAGVDVVGVSRREHQRRRS